MVNDKFVQLQGPFEANEELINKLKDLYPDFQNVKKLGIQSKKTHICRINGQDFEIGKTEILQFNEVKITSLFFKQYEPASTIVDCLLE